VDESLEERPVGTLWRYYDNINMDLMETGCEG